jgi:DNA-binding NtrC family response regulator
MARTISTDHLIGESEWTKSTRGRIEQVAGYRSNVLINGPTGTGKELVARALHTHSSRKSAPFIPVNCAAIPNSLFASQLFGHVKGAFTGAQHAALGCFRAADGGTIFLDEIGELDLDLQAKLLRVLQDREVVPVGGHAPIPVDVRVVAATNRDLEEEVRKGNFRLDLYYRLNVIVIDTLPLTDRLEDIEPLANYVLAKAAVENGLPLKQLSPEALALLQVHDWPGNVRELQNVLERAMLFTEDDVIGPEAFDGLVKAPRERATDEARVEEIRREVTPAIAPVKLGDPMSEPVFDVGRGQTSDDEAQRHGHWLTLSEMEAEHIRRTLEETFYNQTAAANLLGVDRKLLSRKIRKYGLDLPVRRRGRPTKNWQYTSQS